VDRYGYRLKKRENKQTDKSMVLWIKVRIRVMISGKHAPWLRLMGVWACATDLASSSRLIFRVLGCNPRELAVPPTAVRSQLQGAPATGRTSLPAVISHKELQARLSWLWHSWSLEIHVPGIKRNKTGSVRTT